MSSPSPETSPGTNFVTPPSPPPSFPTSTPPSPPPSSPPSFPTSTPPSPPPSSPPSPPPTPNGLPSPGPPASTPRSHSTAPSPTLTPPPPPSRVKIGLVIGIVSGGLLMLIFVGVCTFCYKRRRQNGMDNSAPPTQQSKADQFGGPPQQLEMTIPPPTDGIALGLSPSAFTYDELAIATDGFSNSKFLGQGGSGNVYKGDLPNGKIVAIKQLKSGSGQGDREFQAEVEVISRVHHRHLVSLVGYCMAGGQRMLVYEFVPNNTLEYHLHGKHIPIIDWPTRMKIAIGSAKGLAYLHEDCQPKIIHRDIKASNILLDDNFVAKVADFGLVKILSDTDTHVSTRIMGTIGYLAPEYASSGKLTDKSDVFSFGVVLLQLITGRKPVDKSESFPDDSMVEWARPLLTQALETSNFDALADPRLQKNYNSDEMNRMIVCAATCVRQTARRRPRMSQVVRALEGNISLDDLNEGSTAGHGRVLGFFESSNYDGGQHKEDLKGFRKLALQGQAQSTSEYSGPSSEYGQHQSTSSSSGQQNKQETVMGGNVKR